MIIYMYVSLLHTCSCILISYMSTLFPYMYMHAYTSILLPCMYMCAYMFSHMYMCATCPFCSHTCTHVFVMMHELQLVGPLTSALPVWCCCGAVYLILQFQLVLVRSAGVGAYKLCVCGVWLPRECAVVLSVVTVGGLIQYTLESVTL